MDIKTCQTRLESNFFRSTSGKSSASPVILSEQLLMFYLGLSLADIPSAAHDRRPVFDLTTLKESIATKKKVTTFHYTSTHRCRCHVWMAFE